MACSPVHSRFLQVPAPGKPPLRQHDRVTYAVTVDVDLPKGAPELDVLQREGVGFLLRKGLDSIAAIEGPDGMEVDLVDDAIAVHPAGVLLKLFIDAPALEFAEDAAREV